MTFFFFGFHTWAWSVIPIVATGPSCFTHSCEEAYFNPSKTAQYNLQKSALQRTTYYILTTTIQAKEWSISYVGWRKLKAEQPNFPCNPTERERERERERENPLKLKEKNTRREAAGDRECRREMGFGGTRNSECIGCGRSPHSQSHVIFYVICVSGYLKRRGR